jgi:predicted protein tyrosine phosphatase
MAAAANDPIRTLFLCQYNQRRSATAERVFAKDPGLDVRSAGTSDEALVRVNQRMLEWADVVFVMEDRQRSALDRMFPGHPALERVVCLDIQDNYHFLDPELVTLLRDRAQPYLSRLKQGG